MFYDQTKFGLRLTELSGDRQLVLKGTRETPEQRRGVAHTSSSVLCLGAGKETTKVESGYVSCDLLAFTSFEQNVLFQFNV